MDECLSLLFHDGIFRPETVPAVARSSVLHSMDEFDDFLRLGDTFFTPFVLFFNCMDSMQPSQKPESNGMAEAFG
jgi:hypothetical protein